MSMPFAGNAGAPACMDAEAARRDAEDHGYHAGGTGVAGAGACVPGGIKTVSR